MSVENTLKERGSVHGDFTDNAEIADRLEAVMRDGKNWHSMPATHRIALMHFCSKVSRILSGDPNFADHWHDIGGYAKCVEERLPKPRENNKPRCHACGKSLPVGNEGSVSKCPYCEIAI